MRRLIFIIFVLLIIIGLNFFKLPVFAHMMPFNNTRKFVSDDHTKEEEAKGKEINDKLKKGLVKCKNLKDQDYEVLGEYFMGQMAGKNHPSMNQMMKIMMGKEGERQAHINLGKKLSGCVNSYQYLPMMGMMGGFSYWPMGWFFGIYWLIFSFLVLLVLVLLVIYLYKKIKDEDNKKRR